MKDIQSLEDTRQIDIRKVGVKNISYPITVLDKARATQETIASVNMYVNLPHLFKGTHMSRFIEILNQFHGKFNLETLHLILEEMKNRLNAEEAHFEIFFPFFFHTNKENNGFGAQRYNCRMHGSLKKELDLIVEVDVPVSLHASQIDSPGLWGTVAVSVRLKHFVWLEDLITLIEKAGNGKGMNKENSAEKVCRKVGETLAGHNAFSWYNVVVENTVRGYTTTASQEGP